MEADLRTVERGMAPKETDTFGLDIEVKELPGKVTVRGYEVEGTPREGSPFPEVKRTDRKKTYVLPYFADFVPKRTVRLPYAYLIPVFDETIAGKLRGHGLAVEKLTESATLEVEAFRLKEVKGADRLYQGHRTNQIKGEPAVERREFPKGTLVVRMAQPLANLAAYLLEPESDDGLLLWNAFDKYIAREWGRGVETYPVFKLYTLQNLAADGLD